MAHPRDTRNESFQCIACAIRQKKGRDIDESDMMEFLNWTRSTRRMFEGDEWTRFQDIKKHVRIPNQLLQPTYTYSFTRWLEQDAIEEEEDEFEDFIFTVARRGTQLDQWVNSCVWIANKLAKTNYFRGTNNIFLHADQLPIKDTAVDLMKDLKDGGKDPIFKRAMTFAAKGTGDKWNPADMYSVRDQSELTKVRRALRDRSWVRSVVKMKKLNKNLENRKKFMQNVPGMKNNPMAQKNLKVQEDMGQLYTYNNWVDKLVTDRICIPISLKKADSSSPPIKLFKHAESSSVEQALELNIEITSVDYKPDAMKTIVNFTVNGERNWFLDIRGFESKSKGVIQDVQLQLQHGTAANHGKITLPFYSFIVESSGGMQAIRHQRRVKGIIFKAVGISKEHVFTPNTIFNDYARRRTGEYSQATLRRDLVKWATYVHWLSKGRIPSPTVATSDSTIRFFQNKLGRGRNPSASAYIEAAKYLKHKVQSAEAGFVVDISRPGLTRIIKENIMKSVYTYGASKGLTIFNKNGITEHVQSSTFLKVGG